MKLTRAVLADLLVLTLLAAFTLWYLTEAWTVADSVENLILILPVSLLVLLLCLFDCCTRLLKPQPDQGESLEPVTAVLPVMVLFAGYVLSLEWLGFDLATMLFIAAFLMLQGERRPIWVLGYSLSFGMLVAIFFSNMLPYPMPMMFFASDY